MSDNPDAIQCSRCGEQKPPMVHPPMIAPPSLAEEVHRNVCAVCWAEWQGMEVMVINELRLNFMDPKSQPILDQQMREFLGLATDDGPKELHLPDKERYEAEQEATGAEGEKGPEGS